ncbi:MAG TPA: hypothetical protein VNO35_16760 [Steroidobacteraceae bacterium]|nr:hypothetical protein [Steroidobacteraceae bacterium]
MSSIDKRSRRGWRARIRIPGHKDKTRSFNTQSEALEWARITEAQLRSGVDTIPDAAVAMLLRYTQMNVGHLVDRLDATEASRPTESAKRPVGPSTGYVDF